ncbi:unnamed protein product [Caenorhabditis angaria]|uniref:Uncharacterized protein n=1 Tax=Caenorhabditis angaria TaxID=860376 RepID=A0A9P1N894_9PELO|nr:unnamed protein product [Caenorhabditis angaria]
MILINLLSIIVVVQCDVITDVEEAVMDAIEILSKLQAKQVVVEEHHIPNSQQANEASKIIQSHAEIFEEATQVLVSKYGLDIIPIANKIAESWKNQSAAEVIREKRNAECPSPPQSCSDPFHQTTRTISGACNNIRNPTWGSAETTTRRLLGSVLYSDGLNRIRTRGSTGRVLPSAREISNRIHDSGNRETTSKTYNHLLMQMGQFLAHDIIFMPSSVAQNGRDLNCTQCDSPTTVSPNCAPIPVPSDDPYFKINCIRLTRALNGQTGFGIRQQINQNTHFIDLSAVYGSEDCEAVTVREFKDGRLLEYRHANYVLPPQNKEDENCQSTSPKYCFTCGDFRNSLHPALIPIHTIFIKQHNRLAQMIRQARNTLRDEQIFQIARKIMIAQWQHFVYSEYLPNILPMAVRRKFDIVPLARGNYRGYDRNQDPSLTNEFAGAAFRFGHSQVRNRFQRIDRNGHPSGDYRLGNDIFYASQMYLDGIGGWEPILIGMIRSESMEVDKDFSFSMRNEMFRIRGQEGSGVDMAAMNIMRGRDIGLLPYTSYRTFSGLSEVKGFNDLRSEFTQENIDLLRNVYRIVGDIDLYVGILTEKHMDGGIIGPTGANMIGEGFMALKKGDRFFYENRGVLTDSQLAEIRKSTFSKTVCENTDAFARNVSTQIFHVLSRVVDCRNLPDINIQPFL